MDVPLARSLAESGPGCTPHGAAATGRPTRPPDSPVGGTRPRLEPPSLQVGPGQMQTRVARVQDRWIAERLQERTRASERILVGDSEAPKRPSASIAGGSLGSARSRSRLALPPFAYVQIGPPNAARRRRGRVGIARGMLGPESQASPALRAATPRSPRLRRRRRRSAGIRSGGASRPDHRAWRRSRRWPPRTAPRRACPERG